MPCGVQAVTCDLRPVACDVWQDNLSALDILSASNLINYFGKTVLAGAGVGQIAVQPILLNKVRRSDSRCARVGALGSMWEGQCARAILRWCCPCLCSLANTSTERYSAYCS